MRLPRLFRVALLTSAVAAAPASADAKSFTAPRYDVHIDIQRDGSLVVTETTEFRFTGGPFRRVYREVPTRRTDGITDVEAWLDDRPALPGSEPGQTETTFRGGRVRVEWHIPDTSDATRRLRLRYRASGVAERLETGDLVAWTVLPRDHDYTIAASRITITWPPGLTPTSAPVLSREATPVPVAQGAAFDVGQVRKDRSLTVSVTFPSGSIAPALPRWQQREAERDATRSSILGLAAGLGLGTLAVFAFLWARSPKAPRDRLPGDQEAVMPHDRPVAIASALRAHAAGPRQQDGAAVLLDLARRGHLRIEEAPRRMRVSSRRFELRRTATSDRLAPHERVLLDGVFTDKGVPQATTEFTVAARRMAKHWRPFRAQVASEMTEAGLVDHDRLAARHFLQKLAITILIAAAFGIAGSAMLFADRWGGWVVLPGAAVAAAALGGLFLSRSISPLSDRGAGEAARWDAFGGALRRLAKGDRPLGDDARMHGMLPYAVAFGVGAALATRFHKEQRALPGWFQALPGEDGGSALVAMLSSQAATGHGAGAGGAGGAAGGGSSGAH